MRLFGKYLWQYRLVFLLLLLFVGIFTGIFALYDLEAEAVLYAAGWCLFCAVLLLGGALPAFSETAYGTDPYPREYRAAGR